MSDSNGSDPTVSEVGSAGDASALAWSAIGTTSPAAAATYPGPGGVRASAATLTVGRYNNAVSKIYVTTGGQITGIAAGNAAIINFGSVSAGSFIDDVSIQAIATCAATGWVFW